jgi:ABC-2 type transport system ATP-binding protein
MCDRVAIIHRGRTLAQGTVSDLLEGTRGQVRFAVEPAERALEVLRRRMGPAAAEADGAGTVLARMEREQVPDAVAALAADGVRVFAVERPSSSLEEVFLEVTGGETV